MKKSKKGMMGFDQMALGLGVLAIVLVMTIVVLAQVQVIDVISDPVYNASGDFQYYGNENESAYGTIGSGLDALSLYGDFFSIIVILGIFVGIIGLLFMVTRNSGGTA